MKKFPNPSSDLKTCQRIASRVYKKSPPPPNVGQIVYELTNLAENRERRIVYLETLLQRIVW